MSRLLIASGMVGILVAAAGTTSRSDGSRPLARRPSRATAGGGAPQLRRIARSSTGTA